MERKENEKRTNKTNKKSEELIVRSYSESTEGSAVTPCSASNSYVPTRFQSDSHVIITVLTGRRHDDLRLNPTLK